jgi:glutamate-1-semialdehyde 2,1-aminomutase
LANGYPVSAIAGHADIMKQMEEVFFSFTFGGEALSLAAAKATLEKLKREPVAATLAERGRAVIDGARAIIERNGLQDIFNVSGHPSWSFLNMRDARGATAFEIKTLWMQEIIERGVLSVGTHNISYAHGTAEVNKLLDVYAEVLPFIGKTLDAGKLRESLRCEPLVPLFKVR